MSAALINRSLTTIRTELEFLRDSEVIDDALYEKLVASIPEKYQKQMQPWGVDKISDLSAALANTSIKESPAPAPQPVAHAAPQALPEVVAPPQAPPRDTKPAPVGYCKALYPYNPAETDDLALAKDDKIAVLEHLSEDWWKGYKQQDPSRVGVFPSNYVNLISQQEFETRKPVPAPGEKASYEPQQYSEEYAPPKYDPYQASPQPIQQQPSYGGYAQYPPQPTNYYQQPQQQQPQTVVEQSLGQSHLRKFGGKLGNAAIFGAGATIGSDIVNSIF